MAKPHSPFSGIDNYLPADTGAIRAMAVGEATPDQQSRALKFIVETLCATYDLSYRETDRDTAFVEGRRFVGTQIVKHTRLDLERVVQLKGTKNG